MMKRCQDLEETTRLSASLRRAGDFVGAGAGAATAVAESLLVGVLRRRLDWASNLCQEEVEKHELACPVLGPRGRRGGWRGRKRLGKPRDSETEMPTWARSLSERRRILSIALCLCSKSENRQRLGVEMGGLGVVLRRGAQ